MADLLSVAKGQFPKSRIILSGVLKRGDISNSSIYLFNEQLDLMCNNFGVVFVDANDSIKRYHLARDGRHLNRTGNHLLGKFISSHIQGGVDVVPSAVSSVPLPLAPTSSETAALDGHPSLNDLPSVASSPPNIPYSCFTSLFHALFIDILSQFDEVILMGDFNVDLLGKNKPEFKYFRNLLASMNLAQIVNEPTRETDNTAALIDHIIVRNSLSNMTVGVVDTSKIL
ncbi:hypothetical protein J6590_095817 [Homalodisca vitripennis]|nr:hypothetical protein J6590_095817 [Homalodisca vitripennis]